MYRRGEEGSCNFLKGALGIVVYKYTVGWGVHLILKIKKKKYIYKEQISQTKISI